ncbi:MAG: phenylalanine--tRNA ligase subunit beta [Patescibacteria group bacterium]|nr:phenylalanine--tRNA ligase subunit beta [Patescibacteria group bacterium]
MKISYNLLKKIINIDKSANDIAEKLNLSGTEVESVSSLIDEKIVVAEIKNIKPHPNADRLQLVTVFNGNKEMEIVCGGKNIAIGQYVSLAQLGAHLGDLEIKPINIRGVESCGMLCSKQELGISNHHDGIFILDDKYKIGEPLAKYIKSDTIFELEITPNRGDCLSHLGIARELSAIYKQPLIKIDINLDFKISKLPKLDVEVKDTSVCPQYFALKLSDIKVGESPNWLKDALISCGMKPINNIVDVANYVMLMLGQPLHTFDASKIKDNTIVVRHAKENEEIICLDDTKRKLATNTLVISDSKNALAIAGIIGGKNSAIDNNTTEIIIEAAEFSSKNIRQTMKTLKVSTEASYRYERKIDSGNIENAIKMAASLIIELAEGKIVSSITHIGDKPALGKLNIEYTKINNLLGLNLTDKKINDILASLGFVIKDRQCLIPLWRHDIDVWQDLAEEVGRMYGYNKIKLLNLTKNAKPKQSLYYFKEHIKDILYSNGYCEVMNYSFASQAKNISELLEVANPLQPENKYLRNSLRAGILKSIAKNPSFDVIRIFEIGNVFNKKGEHTELCLCIAQNKIFDLKNTLAAFANQLNINLVDLLKNGKLIKTDQTMLKHYKIRKQNVQMFSIPISSIFAKPEHVSYKLLNLRSHNKYRPVSKYETISRDLAFIIDKNINFKLIESEILSVDDKIILVELFDEYISDKFGKNKKNIAFHIWLQDINKTINNTNADLIVNKIALHMKKKYRASLRTY